MAKGIDNRLRAFFLLALMSLCAIASAQVAAPQAPAPSQRKASTTVRQGPLIVENRATAPQVVTILHRLNGLKMFRLLLRSSDEVGAIARLDDAFRMTEDVHTNVIAGLALDDGQTIAAWLPEAEAEMGPPAPPAPGAPPAPVGLAGAPVHSTRATTPGFPFGAGAASLFERPDVTVIARDGKRLVARFIGLDGVTGLSILKLADKGLFRALEAKEEAVGIGQHLRLFGPVPVIPESRVAGTIYARMGETEGRVVDVTRAPSGAIARVKLRSAKLSQANIGGIVINDAGETVGIVDGVESNEATVLPSALVRSAANRVIERQSSVPRPWLGIQGEPIETLRLDEILLRGWQRELAVSLAEARRGIMLTSVSPGSPAAVAALRPGDVILRVNQEEVKSAEDFSWLLEEAGPGGLVHFTVARLGKLDPESLQITLSESPDPFFGLRRPNPGRTEVRIKRTFNLGSLSSSLMTQGIETIELRPQVASRFGANSGLLVVYVQPASAAFKAGLRSGDLIEGINGQQVSSSAGSANLVPPTASYSFNIVRNKERHIVKVVTPQK
jgi:serine protease Do